MQINITNDDISKSLSKILKLESEGLKRSMNTLLSELINENHNAAHYFVKIILGNALPVPPASGFMGYVNIDRFKYDKEIYDSYLNSPHNQNGYIQVMVKQFNGYTKYSQIDIIFPNQEDKSIRLEDFMLNTEGDLYDSLPF